MLLLLKSNSKASLIHHLTQADRHQLKFGSLEELNATDDPVRFLNAVAEKMEIPFPILKDIRIGKDFDNE